MPDIFTKEKRSWVMSRIRSTNTAIDNIMQSVLEDIGVRFEKYPKMYGNPDFIIPSRKVAIFCDGDFWHGYNYLKKGKKLSAGYWKNKIIKNIERDREVTRELKTGGWVVLRFWEHQILKNRDACAKRISAALARSK